MVLVFQKIFLFGKQDKQLNSKPCLYEETISFTCFAFGFEALNQGNDTCISPKYLMTFECKQPLSFPEETELQVKIDATCVLHAPQGEKKNK